MHDLTTGEALAAARDAAERARRARAIEDARHIFGVSPELAAFVPEHESDAAVLFARVGTLHKLATFGAMRGVRAS